MEKSVDFENVSLEGLETSPVAKTLAGLRANEARYYKNKYNHSFIVVPANESQPTIDYINNILQKEKGLRILSKPLETSTFTVENLRMAYVFYESGLSINVMYNLDDPKKRAVGLSFRRDGSSRRT